MNFKANEVCPRSLDGVYPELVLNPSKGEVEGVGMTREGEIHGVNFKANVGRPRPLDGVYPELVLSPSKGEVEGPSWRTLAYLMSFREAQRRGISFIVQLGISYGWWKFTK